ncbi:homoserine O-acetyltransferase [Cantharellus anzutake]|uniref:homoserine O-acetyltransferase n=1 Tax=Cantharellus anzutake TaxID=1750568 RepID=UPI0019064D62|nr:homoserine O-acetyltransferase [Cantharellus anzutake]KAF8344250.1 homoserine O-acetyltransferase [Cantharellus anzutake]
MSPLAELVNGQTIVTIPSFTLENGVELKNVPVAYKTWGRLNDAGDNVMLICHAFTGSADVEDWWGPLMGPGKVFDASRFFIFCGNVLGSPYGSASPLTIDPDTGLHYGPEFPSTTIRDDVRLHKIILDRLGVSSVAVAIGGSMGGMAVLEWPVCAPPGYIRNIVPVATSARHSAWCISWGEAQRQSIYSDPLYADGYYDINDLSKQPTTGLAAARMAALLTYRSRDSFESKFGRKIQAPTTQYSSGVMTPPDSPRNRAAEARNAHNDGCRKPQTSAIPSSPSSRAPADGAPSAVDSSESAPPERPTSLFRAQSYLRYQGEKFNSRFDANCYIHISRKLDTHDLARDRLPPGSASGVPADPDASLTAVLSTLPHHTLVISISSDGLFTPSEQSLIATCIPNAKLITIPSPDGHDGFLLEFEAINKAILGWMKERLPEIMNAAVDIAQPRKEDDFRITKTSTFGEAEVDVTQW